MKKASSKVPKASGAACPKSADPTTAPAAPAPRLKGPLRLVACASMLGWDSQSGEDRPRQSVGRMRWEPNSEECCEPVLIGVRDRLGGARGAGRGVRSAEKKKAGKLTGILGATQAVSMRF